MMDTKLFADALRLTDIFYGILEYDGIVIAYLPLPGIPVNTLTVESDATHVYISTNPAGIGVPVSIVFPHHGMRIGDIHLNRGLLSIPFTQKQDKQTHFVKDITWPSESDYPQLLNENSVL